MGNCQKKPKNPYIVLYEVTEIFKKNAAHETQYFRDSGGYLWVGPLWFSVLLLYRLYRKKVFRYRNSLVQLLINTRLIIFIPFYPFPEALSTALPEPPAPLPRQKYFHGSISRIEAEALLEKDGQFLIRESSKRPGQYVLTGMANGQPQHLLLMDKEGRVRSCD